MLHCKTLRYHATITVNTHILTEHINDCFTFNKHELSESLDDLSISNDHSVNEVYRTFVHECCLMIAGILTRHGNDYIEVRIPRSTLIILIYTENYHE